MERIAAVVTRYLESWTMADPAVALGLFGTGVGLAVPELSA